MTGSPFSAPCPKCGQRAPIVLHGLDSRCAACGAPRFLLAAPNVSLAGQPWELYDMDADRTELHDLRAEYPDRVAAMAAQYDAWAKRTRVVSDRPPAASRKQKGKKG